MLRANDPSAKAAPKTTGGNAFKTILKYLFLASPTAVLLVLGLLIFCGGWVAAVLRGETRFADAPAVVQKLTRNVYFRTRSEWPTIPECASFDSNLLYRPKPGPCHFVNTEFDVTLNFDERGFRRTAPPAASARRPRLIMLGDSHTMGWGVEDGETFASLLASEYGFQTLNLGVASYATPRELRRLEREVPLLPDDVIVLQYCDNDLDENRRFAATGRVGPYQQADFERYIQTYRPVPTATLPVTGLVLRMLWRDVRNQLPDEVRLGNAVDADTRQLDPSTALVNAIQHFPVSRSHRVIVVAINDSRTTHLTASALKDAGLELLVPPLAADDFMEIDDHMRPRGHRVIAAAIAASVTR